MRLVKKGPKDDKLGGHSPHNALHSLRATTVEVVTVKDSCISNMVTTAGSRLILNTTISFKAATLYWYHVWT